MPRQKHSSIKIQVYLDHAALSALQAESARLSTRPGKFLSLLIKERAPSFYSHPVQIIPSTNTR